MSIKLHPLFVESYRRDISTFRVDQSKAVFIVNETELLPARYRAAHLFWSWITFLSIPGFICVSIFYKWWVGLLLLVLLTPAMWKSVKKSASEFVLEHALKDAAFFEIAYKKKVICIADENELKLS